MVWRVTYWPRYGRGPVTWSYLSWSLYRDAVRVLQAGGYIVCIEEGIEA